MNHGITSLRAELLSNPDEAVYRIKGALSRNEGRVVDAAKELGVSRRSLSRFIQHDLHIKAWLEKYRNELSSGELW